MGFKRDNESDRAPKQFGGYEPLKAGVYPATIFDVSVVDFAKTASGYEGNDCWNIQFRIADGHPNANRRVFGRLYIGGRRFPSGKENSGLFTFADELTDGEFSAGFNRGEEVDLPPIEQVIGQPVDILVKVTEYNGKLGNEAQVVRRKSKGGTTAKAVSAATTKSAETGKMELDL